MPFTLATTMGLAAIALENTPAFPTYPSRMSTSEISGGLVLPYAAQTIAGKGGAGAGMFTSFSDRPAVKLGGPVLTLHTVLVLMFMSCTSAISSQLIGVSTVLSYDVYKTCELHSSIR